MIKDVVLCKDCLYYEEPYCSFTDQDWDADCYCNYGTRRMFMEKICIKLDPGALVPHRAHEADAGLDILLPEEYDSTSVYPGRSITVDTGVHVEIPKGYVGLLKSKSGLNINHDLVGEGVIDSGYTGSIKVKLYNHGRDRHTFLAGDKIIQLLIVRCETPKVEIVDDIGGGERGDNGFGSTGR